MRPVLFTFDIFGTVLDWRRGLIEACAREGASLAEADFERVVDAQGEDEQRAFRPYREITARSLMSELGMSADPADRVGAAVGRFPPFADSPEGVAALAKIAPIVAMTNSDRAHGEDAQAALGIRFSHWITAEEVRLYKPSPKFWEAVRDRLGIPFGRAWWHVSAYADYDLEVARSLGLTCCFIERAHSRPGPADITAKDLLELAAIARA